MHNEASKALERTESDSATAALFSAPAPGSARKPCVVYACSGCSDAGELADRTARELSQAELALMSCLAGIGGRVKSLMNEALRAESILAIDGCPLNCARNTLELAGFKDFEHLQLHKLGFRKGACPVTPERLAMAVRAGAAIITRGKPNDDAPTIASQLEFNTTWLSNRLYSATMRAQHTMALQTELQRPNPL